MNTVKSEVGKGADVNCIDHKTDGRPTALILAIKAGRDEIARYLISSGANDNEKDGNGNTCLFFLKSNNSVALAKILVENGIDVNAINGFGNTALKFCSAEVSAILKKAEAK